MTKTLSILTGIGNPIDDVKPDFEFGPFTQTWQGVFAVVWGLFIVGALFFLLYALFQMGQAKGSNPGAYASSKDSAIKSGAAFGALLAFGPIVGLIILAVT